MSLLLSALWGSFYVRVVGLVLLGLASLWGYGFAKEWQGEAKGAAKVVDVATKKADANAATAERVGAAVEAGRAGRKNPYTRSDP